MVVGYSKGCVGGERLGSYGVVNVYLFSLSQQYNQLDPLKSPYKTIKRSWIERCQSFGDTLNSGTKISQSL